MRPSLQATQVFGLPVRDVRFTGRERELALLHEKLQSDRRVAVYGMPGVGCNALAREYAHRHRMDHTLIAVLNGSSAEALRDSLVDLGRVLCVEGADLVDRASAANAVLQWFPAHDGWLLIVDCDDVDVLGTLVPICDRGHMIVTSNARPTGTHFYSLQLEPYSAEDAAAVLLALCPSIEAPRDEDRAAARRIATLVGGTPLALEAVARLAEENMIPLDEVRSMLEAGDLDRTTDPAVLPVFTAALQRLRTRSADAADLLALVAMVHPAPLPEFALDLGADHFDVPLRNTLRSPLERKKLLGLLQRAALVRRVEREARFSMHPLVHKALLRTLDRDTQCTVALRTVAMLSSSFRAPSDPLTWPQCEELSPCARTCLRFVGELDLQSDVAIELFARAGRYDSERGEYENAQKHFAAALAQARRTRPAGHTDVARSLARLAWIHHALGHLVTAMKLLSEANSMVASPAVDESVRADVAHLRGRVLAAWGRFDEAEATLNEARLVRTQAHDHRKLSASEHRLACLYAAWSMLDRSRIARAREHAERALTLRREHYNDDMPPVADVVEVLARLDALEAKHGEAHTRFNEVLRVRCNVLGEQHPRTAHPHFGLGLLSLREGDLDAADASLTRAREIAERTGLRAHPRYGCVLRALAEVHTQRGRTDEAAKYRTHAHAIFVEAKVEAQPEYALE
jgi:tetratricopeptide (TPR) repeat protein